MIPEDHVPFRCAITYDAMFSGLHVRIYAKLYPEEAAGIVLVDATHPDQVRYEPDFMAGPAARIPRPIYRLGCALTPLMGRIGLIRLFAQYPRLRPGPAPKGVGPDEWLRLQRLSYQPTALAAAAGCTFEENAAEVRAAGDLGDRPLIVLTSGTPFDSPDPTRARETAAFNDVWVHQLQPQLARLSKRGRQVVVPEGNFGIPYEAPNAVIDAAREVVAELR
jgi:pimeloyl-ACP methyl ester carboxylesterase